MALGLNDGLADGAAIGVGVVHCYKVGECGVLKGHGHVVDGLEGAESKRFFFVKIEVFKRLDGVVCIF